MATPDPFSRTFRTAQRVLVLLALLLAASAATVPAVSAQGEPDYTYGSYLEEGSQPEHEVVATYNVLIETRDGDEVAADVYLPGRDGEALPGPWPTILHYTPYDKQPDPVQAPTVHADAEFFTPRGYAVVVADIPGEGNSSGAQPDGILTMRTTRAGYDVVEWISDRSWSDGQVGMHGLSFPGFIANRVMGLAPPHLEAVFSSMSDSDYYLDVAYPGGLFAFNNQVGFGGFYGQDQAEPPNQFRGEDPERYFQIWFQRLTQTRNLILEVSSHPTDGPWWDERSPDTYWENVTASVYHYGGWRDLFLRGNVRNYVGIDPPDGASNNLIIGPWTHGGSTGIDYRALQLRFFDSELKGMANGLHDDGPVRLWIQGAEEWHDFADWPAPGTATERLFLRAEACGCAQSINDGSLLPEPPKMGESTATLVYEPATAGYGEGGELFESVVPPADQRAEEVKKLTFTTEPFEQPTTIIGSPNVRLFASSSAEETQFSVKVTDVHPDGTSQLLKEGWLNATHRGSHVTPEPLVAGDVYPFDIEIWPIGNRFAEGHRLRVDIALSDFPRVLGSEMPSTVTLHHDADRASFVDLPVVEGTTGGQVIATVPTTDTDDPAAGGSGVPPSPEPAGSTSGLPATGAGSGALALLALGVAVGLRRRS